MNKIQIYNSFNNTSQSYIRDLAKSILKQKKVLHKSEKT